jgi:hypothetical protein
MDGMKFPRHHPLSLRAKRWAASRRAANGGNEFAAIGRTRSQTFAAIDRLLPPAVAVIGRHLPQARRSYIAV